MTTESMVKNFSIPMGVLIEDIRRAIKILSDSGGQAKWTGIETGFGTKSSEKTLLSWALSSAVAFGLIEPHKRRTPYVVSEDGKKFLSSDESQGKSMLLQKFLGLKEYRKILVTMKNNQDKALKKQTITEMWLQIRDNVKLSSRQLYTKTFASVGAWCGALKDTGQTCTLTPEGETVLSQILGGEETEKPVQPLSLQPTQTGPLTTPVAPTLPAIYCPHCAKTEIGIEDEELLNTLSSDGTNILIIKTTYYCRGCSRAFSIIGQRLVRTGD